MIKSQFWKGLLPLILTAVLLSACINVTADYLFQLNDALPNYDTWIEEVVIPYNKMLDSRTNGNPEVTYGQLITNTFQNYLAGDPRRADLTWDAADLQVVKEQAQLVYDGARPLLTQLQKMTPPDYLIDAHLVLQECVKYELNIAATILIFLNENKFEPVNYSFKPCDTVDPALLVLRDFAEQNQ